MHRGCASPVDYRVIGGLSKQQLQPKLNLASGGGRSIKLAEIGVTDGEHGARGAGKKESWRIGEIKRLAAKL